MYYLTSSGTRYYLGHGDAYAPGCPTACISGHLFFFECVSSVIFDASMHSSGLIPSC